MFDNVGQTSIRTIVTENLEYHKSWALLTSQYKEQIICSGRVLLDAIYWVEIIKLNHIVTEEEKWIS